MYRTQTIKGGQDSFIHMIQTRILSMKKFTLHILLGTLLLILASTALCSCSDEESFTTDQGAQLSFSKDTISFDTIFSGITSRTERILVYNKNSKGVRIANVKLESGGTSGFLINVDGRNGTSINNVEVLKKDSVFLFVKVNTPASSSMEPTKTTDAVVFTLESGIQQKVVLEAVGQNIKILRAEVLTTDKTISSDELPYVIYDSLVVAENTTLHILEGTKLYFHNGASLIVHGTLKVEGNREKPVVFRGDRLDNILDYLPYDRLENQWGGIYLSATCKGCDITYADIHSGNYGIVCDGNQGHVNITNTIIHNVAGYGLYLLDSQAHVANTQISNTKYDCVSVYGGTADFYHCTIAQFYPWDADCGNALFVSNFIGEEEHLIQAVNFYNCFVTGYANDEVFGNPGEKPFNLNFHHCVLMTDVSDETYFHNCLSESQDSATYKATNFKQIDTHAYYYDFRLDTLSVARGKGAPSYSSLYPTDMNGVKREDKPDVGCYQYQ